MRATLAMLVVALCPVLAPAADPPKVPDVPAKPVDVPAPIRLPDVDQTQVVPPVKVSTLRTGELYVIDSDVPVILLTSPAGLVTVEEETGPIKIQALFAGNTKRSTRTFKGQQVFTLEAKASGTCELIVTPVGAKKATDVIRRTILVDAGEGPIPPPPGPGPGPAPPPLTPFQTKLKAALAADRATPEAKARYAAFYRAAANTAANDATLKTAGALVADMQLAVKNLGLPPGSLDNTARACEAELAAVLPKNPAAPLDQPTRTLYSATYARVAADLEAIK